VNKYKHPPTVCDVYIGRGSPLGNPFTSIKDKQTKAKEVCDSREESVRKYRIWLMGEIEKKNPLITNELNRIWKLSKQGDVFLVCFCKPKLCHGDVIKEIVENA
jgi:hypothetical protein